MKISTVCLLAGLGVLSLSACKTQNYDDTACSGYLGCSAGAKIGPPESTAGANNSYVNQPLHPINLGCGKALPDNQVPTVVGAPTGYTHYTVYSTGATLGQTIGSKAGPRTFWVRVPADYNPNKKYRTVYVGQGCGPYDSANTSTYFLFKKSAGGDEEAIYVALDIPRDMVNMDCYDNRDGPEAQEWEAFQLFHTVVDSTYCVDNDHVYASGYSTGGWLANMWGCYFAGSGLAPAGDPSTQRVFAPEYHIRGQAATTGGEPPNQPPCNGPVAALWIHDLNDGGNPISGNLSALERVLKTNNCTQPAANSPTAPWHPEIPALGTVCKQYTSCPKEFPVIFCTTAGFGHASQDARAIPAFTTFFSEADQYSPVFTTTAPPATGAGGTGGGAGTGGAGGAGGGSAGTSGGGAGTSGSDAGLDAAQDSSAETSI
jgi:poly(3-hydroxybutyrate) depolymerase